METTCFSCGRKGHFSRECPDFEQTCYTCGKPGHYSRECETSNRKITCYNCGKIGHVLKHCLIPERKVKSYSGVVKRSSSDRDSLMSSRSSEDEEMEYESETNRQSSCYRCGLNGHIARECRQDKTCYNCGKSGHVSRDCEIDDSKTTCYTCGKSGHISRDCEMGDGKINCYTCGKYGHKSFNCPDSTNRRLNDTALCYRCNEPGHISRNCNSDRPGLRSRNIGLDFFDRDFRANKAEADALLKTWTAQIS